MVWDSDGQTSHLIAELGRGGEGAVYMTTNGLACKVYRRDRIRRFVIDKLNLMVKRKVFHPAICWPRSLAHNDQGEVVGYFMPMAAGKELRRTVFIPPVMRASYPHWTRLHLAKLASKVVEAIDHLHGLDVLVGDINPANIIIQGENAVFLVDCDSYQVDKYPCPVGIPTFLAPELLKCDLPRTLRTNTHEYFALATLIFMILHPGKPPYSHKGGGDPSNNVRKGNFPYQRGDKGSHGVPDGPWRYMWSHLTDRMQKAFERVFRHLEPIPTSDWKRLLGKYQHALRNGYVSDDPFPKDFKRSSKRVSASIPGERVALADEGIKNWSKVW